jgi:nicotinate-nucleotide adenylyltransferase
MSTDGRRLGVLGGTLDPIHVGHLDAADAARTALSLDEVVFIPSHDPPHRLRGPRASAFHRFALAALAVDGRPGYSVSDVELRRRGASYTALTLGELHNQGWQPSQIFFIIGADAFAEITTWYGYPAILDACNFAVVSRPGVPVSTSLTPEADGGSGEGRRVTRIVPIDAITRDVSSSAIRARLAAGQSIDNLVPPAVARHIHTHGLYR